MTGTIGINLPVHNMALNSLTQSLGAIRAKGYGNINIVAHSWGTVLSRDAQYAGGAINSWFTMGAPLPRTTRRPDNLTSWFNFFSPDDPVVYCGPGIALLGFEGGSGFLWERAGDIQQFGISGGHSSYWTSGTVLNTIGNQLSGQ